MPDPNYWDQEYSGSDTWPPGIADGTVVDTAPSPKFMTFEELSKPWLALHERDRVTGGSSGSFLTEGEHWWDGGSVSVSTSGGVSTMSFFNADGTPWIIPTWWFSTHGADGDVVDGKPSLFDIIIDDESPELVTRWSLTGTVSGTTNTVVVSLSTDSYGTKTSGSAYAVRRRGDDTGLVWADGFPEWPERDAGKGFGFMTWYRGEPDEARYYTYRWNTGVDTAGNLPAEELLYTVPLDLEGGGYMCVDATLPAWLSVAYTGRAIDQLSCDPDKFLNRHAHKTINGLQQAIVNIAGGFVDPAIYDGDIYDRMVVDTMAPAWFMKVAGWGGWVTNTTTGGTDSTVKVPGGAGVTLPPDWGPLADTPRPVYYAIIQSYVPTATELGYPEDETWRNPADKDTTARVPAFARNNGAWEQIAAARHGGGVTLASGVGIYDGETLTISGDVGNTVDPNGIRLLERQRIYLAFGPKHEPERRFQYLYPETRAIPAEDDDGLPVDPPTDDAPFTFYTREVSTSFLMYDETPGNRGVPIDDPDSPDFVDGMRARYCGDVQSDPCIRAWGRGDGLMTVPTIGGPDPWVPYHARFVTQTKLGVPEGGFQKYVAQRKPAIVAEGVLTGASGAVLTDSSAHWDDTYTRKRWKGRDLELVEPDGTLHGDLWVSDSADQTITAAGVSGFAPTAGWRYRVREWQPGAVLQWDNTARGGAGAWVGPTDDEERALDANTTEPDTTWRYGYWNVGSKFNLALLSQIRDGIDKLTDVRLGTDWVAPGTQEDGSVDEMVGKVDVIYPGAPDYTAVTDAWTTAQVEDTNGGVPYAFSQKSKPGVAEPEDMNYHVTAQRGKPVAGVKTVVRGADVKYMVYATIDSEDSEQATIDIPKMLAPDGEGDFVPDYGYIDTYTFDNNGYAGATFRHWGTVYTQTADASDTTVLGDVAVPPVPGTGDSLPIPNVATPDPPTPDFLEHEDGTWDGNYGSDYSGKSVRGFYAYRSMAIARFGPHCRYRAAGT